MEDTETKTLWKDAGRGGEETSVEWLTVIS